MENIISEFSGDYRFLSNFWMASFDAYGFRFASVEHGYQACKAVTMHDAELILRQRSPFGAKKMGKKIQMHPQFMGSRLSIMTELVRAKFTQNPELSEMLLATGDALLIEGNHWGDTYWGMSRGVGENHLGRILMDVRKELKIAS